MTALPNTAKSVEIEKNADVVTVARTLHNAIGEKIETGVYTIATKSGPSFSSSREGTSRRVKRQIDEMFRGRELPPPKEFDLLYNAHNHPTPTASVLFPWLKNANLENLLSGPSSGDAGAADPIEKSFGRLGIFLFLNGHRYVGNEEDIEPKVIDITVDAGGAWVSRVATKSDWNAYPETAQKLNIYLETSKKLHARLEEKISSLSEAELDEHLQQFIRSSSGIQQARILHQGILKRNELEALDIRYPAVETPERETDLFLRTMRYLLHRRLYSFGRTLDKETEPEIFRVIEEIGYTPEEILEHNKEAEILADFGKFDVGKYNSASLGMIRASTAGRNVDGAIHSFQKTALEYGGIRTIFVPKNKFETIPAVARQLANSFDKREFRKKHRLFEP